ncbi:hypothetical protein ACSBR1_005507 [Camellia fascicularis]
MQFGKAYRTIKCCSLFYACVVSKAYRTIKVLKPNGYLLFCDYATGDLTQIAFAWDIVDIYFCVRRAFILYMEDIYFCTILCFGNTMFLYVILFRWIILG